MAVEAHLGRPRRKRRLRRLWLLAAVLLVGAVGAVLLWRPRQATDAAAAQVTTTVSSAPYQVTVDGPGSLSPVRSVALSASVSGTIEAIAAVGDRVEQGTSVARLAPAPFQRSVDDARLALDRAESSLAALQAAQAKTAAGLASQIASSRNQLDAAQRAYDAQQRNADLTETLYKMGSASALERQSAQDALRSAQEALANAQTDLTTLLQAQTLQETADTLDRANGRVAVEQARLSLTSALQDLADTTLVAPFGGVVSATAAAVGEPTGGSGALLTLVDDAHVVLDAQIDETDIGRVAVAQPATVTLDAVPGRTFPGRVTRIAPTATLVSNIPIFYVAVEVDNTDHVLRAGMTGQATVVVQEISAAFRLPVRAVHSAGDGSYVQVRGADGSFRQVPVTVVGASGIQSVVTGALPDGATVLVSGDAATGPAGSQGSDPPRNDRRPSAVPFAGPGGGFRNPRRLRVAGDPRP